jgi:hypothetical protein
MKTGALIFAFNNEHTNYVQLAAWNANNIRRHLDIPVAVVTDARSNTDILDQFDVVIHAEPEAGGQRHFTDYNQTVTWYNAGRTDAYDLSPWDQTLLLDADYVVASDSLQTVINSHQDFLAHQTAVDATGENDFSGLNYFGSCKMPMWWATVVMFQKSSVAKMIFESIKMVRYNWPHYRRLYQTGTSVYRNDHALSIALGIVDGHTLTSSSIPWNLVSVLPDHRVSQVGTDHYRIDYVNSQNQLRWLDLCNQDFHAMGKKHLGDIVAKSFT